MSAVIVPSTTSAPWMPTVDWPPTVPITNGYLMLAKVPPEVYCGWTKAKRSAVTMKSLPVCGLAERAIPATTGTPLMVPALILTE